MAKNRATKKLASKTDEQQTYLALVKRLRQGGVQRGSVPTFASFQNRSEGERMSLQRRLLGGKKERDKSRTKLADRATKSKIGAGTKRVLRGTSGRLRSDLLDISDPARRKRRKK